jgi:hypothetical protein
LLAVVYTGLTAFIPVQIDDDAYVRYARQIAAHPLDPYGFVIQWYDAPQPANEVLAPPVFPYSLAPAVGLLGEQPALWKLALLPWSLLLAFALHAHLRRFAPGLELRLTAFLMLSPALLPSLNLMLDVPALGLSLAAIYQFVRACDIQSVGWSMLAGATAAVAMQTKYTGLSAVLAMVAAALVYRRIGLGVLAASLALVGFAAWELAVAATYGRSHFLVSLETNTVSIADKASLIPVFFSQLGGVAPALVLLGLAAVGLSFRQLLTAGVALALGYAIIGLIDARYVGVVRLTPRLFGTAEFAPWRFELAEVIFDAFAAIGVFALVRVLRRLPCAAPDTGRADTRFLVAWLAVETGSYVLLTPFPAARRVLGVFVVVTLLFGRLASGTCASRARLRLINGIVGFSVLLGLAYLAVDWIGAQAYQRGARLAAEFVGNNGSGRVWYWGRWGFRYYAERCGMLAVVPRYEATSAYLELPAPSTLRAGDWLVVARDGGERSGPDLTTLPASAQATLLVDDPLPLRVLPCFYGGRTPLEHHEGPRLSVLVYRMSADHEVDCVSMPRPVP